MKRILLSSAAIVAFAGAAAADGHSSIDFSGSATLGYNDAPEGDHNGFYSDINLDVSLSATLDNGLTVTATADVDELDAADAAAGGVTLKIASETASLTYGDVNNAAHGTWKSVGAMDADGFYEQDGEIVLRSDLTLGGVTVAIAQEIDSASLGNISNLNAAISGSFGSVNAIAAFQEGDATRDEIFGIRAGTTVGGVDVALGYASNETTGADSTGISFGYTVGPVALAASYVSEGAGDDNWDVSATYAEGATRVKVYTDESDDYGLEASYDVGNGLVVYAGYDNGDDASYIGGIYDLGGNASLAVSYVDGVNADDEIGEKDFQSGTTVELSFAF